MKNIYLSLIIIASLVLSSCTKDKGPIEKEPITEDVSFSNDVQPIFDESCISCHPSSGNLDLTSENSYNQLVNVDASGYSGKRVVPGDADSSILYKKVDGSGAYGTNMPIGSSLSADDIATIKQWIEEGAKNN